MEPGKSFVRNQAGLLVIVQAAIILAAGITCAVDLTSARADESIYVSNATGNTIEQFTSGGVGSVFANSGLNSPEGLAIDSAGNVYAANVSGIEKYTSAGGPGSVFSNLGSFDKTGLAFDSSGNLYAGVYSNNSIEEYAPNGQLTIFASDPGDHSLLEEPEGLAFDSLGNLYVASFTWIEKFTPGGVGSLFATTGQAAFGLAIDSDDNVFVSYRSANKIEEFDSNGNDLGAFATGPGGNDSDVSLPQGMAFDSDGNLFVANEAGNSFVEEFAPDGTPSRFATDPGNDSVLYNPQFIAIGVPEPASGILAVMAAAGLVGFAIPRCRRGGRLSSNS